MYNAFSAQLKFDGGIGNVINVKKYSFDQVCSDYKVPKRVGLSEIQLILEFFINSRQFVLIRFQLQCCERIQW